MKSNQSISKTSSIIDRAVRYIEKMEPAVQGAGGSTAAFRVAAALTQGFALDKESAMNLFLKFYNQRCSPPWSVNEAEHKIDSAAKAGADRPLGYLLSSKRSQSIQMERRSAGSNYRTTPRKPKSKVVVVNESVPTTREWRAIAASRGLLGPGVFLAARLGLLRVGNLFGNEVWGIGDANCSLCSVRRIDAEPFPAYGAVPEHKAHSLVGGKDSHRPYGFFSGAPIQAIALCEGLTDYIALWDQVVYEYQSIDVFDTENIKDIKPLLKCVPLLMPSTTSRIDGSFPEKFRGLAVRIYVDNDEPGRKAAAMWARSLQGIARSVDQFDCSAYGNEVGRDFNDCFTMVLDGSLPL